MKVFISQPMGGRREGDILTERQNIIERLSKMYPSQDIEVLDTYFTNDNWGPIKCLGESIVLLAQADIAVFAKGWVNARGCRIEQKVCVDYDITHICL